MLTGKLNIDNSALMKRCLDTSTDKTIARYHKNLNWNFMDVIDSHVDAWQNPLANPHLWPEFSQVMDHLKTLIDPKRIMISWYNITLKGGVMKAHHHDRSGHSVFVYYVNCNPSHPPLEIRINNEWIKHPCATGTWLLFSKDTYHRAGINTGTADRISISVNVDKPIL
jgi:hypothetical protein